MRTEDYYYNEDTDEVEDPNFPSLSGDVEVIDDNNLLPGFTFNDVETTNKEQEAEERPTARAAGFFHSPHDDEHSISTFGTQTPNRKSPVNITMITPKANSNKGAASRVSENDDMSLSNSITSAVTMETFNNLQAQFNSLQTAVAGNNSTMNQILNLLQSL